MKANKRASRAARELFRFCVVDGALDESRVRRVATHIASSRQRGTLAILSDFHRRVRLEHDQHTALVESATPLPGPVREHIEADLARAYGSGLDTSFTSNPALIGGVRIKVGSDVYDGSVRARLTALERRF